MLPFVIPALSAAQGISAAGTMAGVGLASAGVGAALAGAYGSKQEGVSRSRGQRNHRGRITSRADDLLASPTNLNEGMTGKNWPAGVPLPGSKPDPRTWAPVLSDDADARASEARRMLQQATPYWEREENQAIRAAAAEGGGPRAGQAGYAQRADIQAWMDAQRAKGPAGQAMVDRFLEQQKKRGLLEAPQPMPMVDQLATSQDAREAAAKGYQGQKLDQAMMAGAEAIEGSAPAADARFEDPNFGTEALRGMPVSPVDSVVGDASARAAALSGYQQAPTTEAFAGASALPNMAFAGNGMTPDQSLQVDREQGVPGITAPISAPEETREMNLGGENALVRRYLNAIQGKQP